MPLSDEDMYKMFGPTSCAPDEMHARKSKIYFIVAYCKPDNKHRCFGYYRSLTAAREALQVAWKNIEECYYDSFFIESIGEGLFELSELIEYYEIEEPSRKLIKKNIPLHLSKTVNWSIG